MVVDIGLQLFHHPAHIHVPQPPFRAEHRLAEGVVFDEPPVPLVVALDPDGDKPLPAPVEVVPQPPALAVGRVRVGKEVVAVVKVEDRVPFRRLFIPRREVEMDRPGKPEGGDGKKN